MMPGFPDRLPLSLYVHLPWCERKCPYCDFNSYATQPLSISAEQTYIHALKKDLAKEAANIRGREIQTVFIGGGTPSLFSGDSVAELLETVSAYLTLSFDAEVTLEANPGSAEQRKFRQFLQSGINRLSLGVQSFNDQFLRRLGRVHTAGEALAAFSAARDAGFKNINIDIMFGLPEQTPQQAEADIQQATALLPEHISYYQLTLEPNTFFHKHPPNLPDDSSNAVIETTACTRLKNAGYQRYEVSAYAQTGYQSRHNMNYWCYGDYLGIGAGAHSKLSLADGSVIRFAKPKHPDSYIRATETDTIRVSERVVNREELIFEFMLNALRLTEGFEKPLFKERTGLIFEMMRKQIDSLKQQGLLEEYQQSVKPSDKGYQFLNDVQMAFLPVS